MKILQHTHPLTGRRIVVGGRRPPNPHTLKLNFARYAANLPAPPASVSYASKALASLRNIYLNDVEGDCVIAAGYHVEGTATGNAGAAPFVATSAQINADYHAIGGYVPGNPATDQGCDEQTALNYWTKHGFANGTKLAGWLAVDPANKAHVQLALYLFENLFFGVGLPDAWVDPFPSGDGFTWDVAGLADQDNGHAFVGVGYDARGVAIDTWGLLGTLTYAAIASYAAAKAGGELYVLLTPDVIVRSVNWSPAGFDWATLVSDFDALGGTVPVPAPSPSPAPTPAAVTLAQAQAWASAGLASNWPKQHTVREQAESAEAASTAAPASKPVLVPAVVVLPDPLVYSCPACGSAPGRPCAPKNGTYVQSGGGLVHQARHERSLGHASAARAASAHPASSSAAAAGPAPSAPTHTAASVPTLPSAPSSPAPTSTIASISASIQRAQGAAVDKATMQALLERAEISRRLQAAQRPQSEQHLAIPTVVQPGVVVPQPAQGMPTQALYGVTGQPIAPPADQGEPVSEFPTQIDPAHLGRAAAALATVIEQPVSEAAGQPASDHPKAG